MIVFHVAMLLGCHGTGVSHYCVHAWVNATTTLYSPNRLSLASAINTLDAPIRALKAAERVEANMPMATSTGHKFIY